MSPVTATLQTPPGRGGIAVIALSGAGAAELLEGVFRPYRSHVGVGDDLLRLGHLVDGREVIDEAIVCRHGTSCEIHIHGGPAAAARTMQLLAARGATIEPARPAATESFPPAHPDWDNPAIGAELLEALPLARGDRALGALTQQWSAGLSELAGRALAADDRATEPGLAGSLRAAAAGLALMQRVLHPAEVVLVGPPNVGKSTLANAMIGRQVALVHPQAGTTRDWVREPAIFAGCAVWLTDTAGLWEAMEPIDAEAVRRARHRAERADLVLLVSAERPTAPPPWLHAKDVLAVWAKADLSPPPEGFRGPVVSAVTDTGLEELKQAVLARLGLDAFDLATPRAFTPRQADLLTRAAEALEAGDTVSAELALRDLLAAGY